MIWKRKCDFLGLRICIPSGLNMYRTINEADTILRYHVSIPTKYQKQAISDQEKKGFSSQAKRFPPKVCLNENPGPCSHACISTAEVKSPSFSKKGTTGFIPAKPTRPSSYPQRGIPGPNAYNLQKSFIDKYDFNSGVSRVFRLPVAVQLDGPKHKTPAPNQYDVSCGSWQRFSLTAGTSAFLSKTARHSVCQNKNMPSPCHYEVNNTIQHSSTAVMSPFKSKTQRIPAPVDNHVPGPGAYSPHRSPVVVKRTILPKGYYLAISAPPVIVPKGPPLPGPGHYNIGTRNRTSKPPVPTAAFASRTERISRNSLDETRPGPGFYNPRIVPKQSFFYNESRVWLPV